MGYEYEIESRSLLKALALERIWSNKLPIRIKPEKAKSLNYKQFDLEPRNLSFNDLKFHYEKLDKQLNRLHCVERSTKEMEFEKLLQRHTSIRPKVSFWFGPFCLDFFFYQLSESSLSNRSTRGLIIEIDGSIHNTEFKTKKDLLRVDAFYKLNIAVSSISNDDFGKETVRSILTGISKMKTLDSRARRRILTKSFYLTLFAWLSTDEIDDLFQVPEGTTKLLLKIYINRGGLK